MSIYGPYVDAKNLALSNVEDSETKALQIEDAEIAKTLAALPASHPSVAALTSRRATIKTVITNKK
jgi:hypothetical protein